MSLADIHRGIEELKQGENFTVKVWTDKAVAMEYRESLDLENNPQKKKMARAAKGVDGPPIKTGYVAVSRYART